MSMSVKSQGGSVAIVRTPVARKSRYHGANARRVRYAVAKPREARQGSKIYFILCQATRRVKCGVATDPRGRLGERELQVGSPTPLKVIAELDGNYSKENAIHRRLDRWHIHGEWFHYVPEVCDIIADEISSHLKALYRGDIIVQASEPDGTALRLGRLADPHIDRFVADCTVSSPQDRIQSSRLYQAFEAWCRSLGVTSCSQKAFTMAMASAGYRRVTSNVVFFLDIALKAPPQAE
ncbi:GIY-YIG nuclease family protein [Bradyrhizobium sp. 150]|uniref:GIY-YIG nuclease family protein n=1 Tax=Bradyrhizobium sp. 150 TaxID=2782625 RepID=UPI001FFAA9B5|nr:GIY-YIG nuclease family protein [Bradyrhizobium sp. 150]MCK1676620.1 GIY-YIG nuclease family protein [Bradyrhizobium sp. 150]